MRYITGEGVIDLSPRFTTYDLHRAVCEATGQQIPKSTFRYWRNKSGIIRDEDGRYGAEEFEYLVGLSRWLSADRVNTIKQYKGQWLAQQENEQD